MMTRPNRLQYLIYVDLLDLADLAGLVDIGVVSGSTISD
jgi:hypothetical protein